MKYEQACKAKIPRRSGAGRIFAKFAVRFGDNGSNLLLAVEHKRETEGRCRVGPVHDLDSSTEVQKGCRLRLGASFSGVKQPL
jgi:hypothetical protein